MHDFIVMALFLQQVANMNYQSPWSRSMRTEEPNGYACVGSQKRQIIMIEFCVSSPHYFGIFLIFGLQITVFGLADLINEWMHYRPLIGWLDVWMN